MLGIFFKNKNIANAPPRKGVLYYDTRKDANQGNKMVIQNDRQLQMWRLPTSGHQYTAENSSNKTATYQPQISHRDRTLFETFQETCRKNLPNL